jgi:hypothetical protein
MPLSLTSPVPHHHSAVLLLHRKPPNRELTAPHTHQPRMCRVVELLATPIPVDGLGTRHCRHRHIGMVHEWGCGSLHYGWLTSASSLGGVLFAVSFDEKNKHIFLF